MTALGIGRLVTLGAEMEAGVSWAWGRGHPARVPDLTRGWCAAALLRLTSECVGVLASSR